MTLITNILHNQFSIFCVNRHTKNDQKHTQCMEYCFPNKSQNIMFGCSGEKIDNAVLLSLRACKNPKEAIEIIQSYSDSICNINCEALSDYQALNPKEHQIFFSYYCQDKQKYLSYSILFSKVQKSMDIKQSMEGQMVYRCIGTDFEDLNILFGLSGIGKKLSKFNNDGKGVENIMEIINLTKQMYNIIHLFDEEEKKEVTFFISDINTKTFFQL